MASNSREIEADSLRIQWLDDDETKIYRKSDNIKVIRETDKKNSIEYLVFEVDEKKKLDDELKTFLWLVDSSKRGIVALETPEAKIVVKYDAEDRRRQYFFDDLERVLEKKRADTRPPQQKRNRTPPPRVQEKQWTADELIDAITRGSRKDAESAAAFLAKSRTEIPLGLNVGQDQPKNRSNSNALRLKLRIDHHDSRDPVTKTILVPKRMTLRALKEQIEDETKIRSEDQFWFAGEKFPIPDDYEFGSDKPVAPAPRSTRSKSNQQDPAPSVQSGDTLVLYVASLPCLKC